MPKQKTHKGMKKRFKVTANGKVEYRKVNRGHMLSSKSAKSKRQARVDGVGTGAVAKLVIAGLRPGL